MNQWRKAMKVKNLVAKYARQFNKATVQRDRKNTYQRRPKHQSRSSDQRIFA